MLEIHEPKIESIDHEASFGYILKLAFPMIVTYMSFTLMQFVDRYMVSFLGTEELAAVLPASAVSFLFSSFALGIIKTLNTFVSQSNGRGDRFGCSNYCWHCVYIGVFYFLIIITFVWPGAPFLFKLMGHEGTVAELEVVYFRIMLYCHLGAIFIWSPGHFFMGLHRTKIMMVAALIGHWLNATFNYLLIFGKFGFPEMGFEGAAWGTFIGIIAEAIILMGTFLLGPLGRSYHSYKALKPDFTKFKNLLKIGIPSATGFVIHIPLFSFILLFLIGRYGKAPLAATNAVLTSTNLAFMPLIGISNALTAIMGKAIGAQRKDIGIKQTNKCLKAVLVYGLIISALYITFKEQLIGIWSSDPAVIAAGNKIFVLAAIFIFFNSFLLVLTGSLRGAGDTFWLASMSGLGCFFILGMGGLVITNVFPGLGATGPWLAAVLYAFSVAGMNAWRFRSNGWAKINIFSQQEQTV